MRNARGQFVKGTHWRPRRPWWGKAWLQEQYAVKSAADIASEHGVTENAILFWLHKHGIPRRSLSEARKLKWWGSVGPDNPMFGVIGPDNPNWKDGRTEGLRALYLSPEWRRLCSALREQAGGRCVRCSSEDRLHVHCTRPNGGVAAHWEENALVVLCRDCHGFVHSRKNTEREYMEGGEGE